MCNNLHHATGVDGIEVVLWELLAADVEGVEGIRAIGAVLEEVLLGLVIFFAGLVLAEAVASSFHACRLDSEDKIIIVLTVEERHQTLLPGKTLVDEKVLLVMAHWVAEVDINDLPPVRLEFFLYYIMEVLVIHGIVGVECGSIVIIDDGLVGVVHVVGAEVGYECGKYTIPPRAVSFLSCCTPYNIRRHYASCSATDRAK